MQKLVAFAATVAVVCVAVVQGQFSVVIPGLGSTYNVLAPQQSCQPLGNLFQDNWTTLPATCTTAAALKTAWDIYLPGATMTAFDTLSTTASLADCVTKANAITNTGARPDAVLLCNYIQSIVDACSCTQMQCLTTWVNGQVNTDHGSVCLPFGREVCTHYAVTNAAASPIGTLCAAAVGVSPPNGNDADYDIGTLPVACSAANCPAATELQPTDEPEAVTTTELPVTDTDASTDTGAVAPPSSTTLARTSTRPSSASGVSSGVYLAAVALGAAAVL